MVYRKDWTQPQGGGQGFARTMKTFGRSVNITTADNTAAPNTVGAFTVPAGFVVTAITAVSSAMASIAFTVGDAAVPGRYLTGGASGATNTTLAATGLLYKNPAETEVLVTVGTAGGAPGTIGVYLTGFIDN